MNNLSEHLQDQHDAFHIEKTTKMLESSGCYDITTEVEFGDNNKICMYIYKGKAKDGIDFKLVTTIESVNFEDIE